MEMKVAGAVKQADLISTCPALREGGGRWLGGFFTAATWLLIMTNKRQRERGRMKGGLGKKTQPSDLSDRNDSSTSPSLLLPVNFGAPQSWVSTKLHIMSSRGGGGGEGCGRKRRCGGHHVRSVLLGRLHKWQLLLSHDISVRKPPDCKPAVLMH